MRVLGIKCAKEKIGYALVEGTQREDATVLHAQVLTAPDGERGEQLVWVRREIQELLSRHQPDEVVLRGVEPGGQGNSLPRAETEGVVREAVAAAAMPCRRVVAVSLRSAFGAKNGAELEAASAAIPAVSATAKTRREPVVVAISALPS